jgi:cell division septation protein DedD
MRARHLVAAITAALICAPLFAQSVKSGINAWQRADYAAAVAIWRPLAERGDADAQFNLGQAYRLGRGVPLDLSKAKGWFEKAADAGHLDAETTLGLLLFQNGDQAAGLKWLRRAAEQGEPRALLVYGTALYNGDGVTQDHVLGYAYVSRAADLGLAPAKETLSQLDSLMPEAERRKALQVAAVKPRPAVAAPVKMSKPVEPARIRALPGKKQATVKPAQHPETIAGPARGSWRIQLGAFAQRSSAEALYHRVSARTALAGRTAVYVPAGSMTRLQVGPFETKAAAAAACKSLGVPCFPTQAH